MELLGSCQTVRITRLADGKVLNLNGFRVEPDKALAGNRWFDLREKLGWTRRKLACQLGLSTETVRAIEHGTMVPEHSVSADFEQMQLQAGF